MILGIFAKYKYNQSATKGFETSAAGLGQVSALLSDEMCKLWSPITC